MTVTVRCFSPGRADPRSRQRGSPFMREGLFRFPADQRRSRWLTTDRPFWYDARLAGEIERRWQERWEREGTFRAQDPGATRRPKFYLLDFFRTPAASGCTWGIRLATSAPTCSAATSA